MVICICQSTSHDYTVRNLRSGAWTHLDSPYASSMQSKRQKAVDKETYKSVFKGIVLPQMEILS